MLYFSFTNNYVDIFYYIIGGMNYVLWFTLNIFRRLALYAECQDLLNAIFVWQFHFPKSDLQNKQNYMSIQI